MTINLIGTFRLSVHLMQTHSLRNTSQSNKICEVNPVPNNLNQVKKMEEFFKDILKEKIKYNFLAID